MEDLNAQFHIIKIVYDTTTIFFFSRLIFIFIDSKGKIQDGTLKPAEHMTFPGN